MQPKFICVRCGMKYKQVWFHRTSPISFLVYGPVVPTPEEILRHAFSTEGSTW